MKDLEEGDQFAVDGVQVADVGFREAVERAVEGGDEPGDQHCRFSLRFHSVCGCGIAGKKAAPGRGGGWELRAKKFPPPPDSENNPESEHQPVPILS